MAISSKRRNVSKYKQWTFSKINKGSRKHFIKSRKNGIKSRKNGIKSRNMSGGANANHNLIQKQKTLNDYKIRIIISGAAGFGNQRASLTLMYKLRLLGFTGIFDIRYIDKYPAIIELTPYVFKNKKEEEVKKIDKLSGFIGRAISILIPEFSPDTNYDKVNQISFEITTETFGKLLITRLPYLPFSFDLQSYNLPETDVTMCGADDSMPIMNKKQANDILHKYNTKNFCSFVPTDWYNGTQFLITNQDKFIKYDDTYRLSSETLFHYTSNEYENSIKQLLTNKNCFSQLVYGLNNIEYFLPIPQVVNNLLKALIALALKINSEGYILLLFPQDIFNFIMDTIKYFETVSIVKSLDDFIPEITKPHKIYLLYVGKLRPQFFDDLMVNLTTLPPVIEGCNSIETCETNARLYLHSSKVGYKIKNYGQIRYSNALVLHKKACLPLENNIQDNIIDTVNFLLDFLNNKLLDYAKQRQTDHLARPDIIVKTLNEIMILPQYPPPKKL